MVEADIPRLYIGEIFPTRIREFGVATGAASQWLFNFVLSQITPHAIANIGWRTFLMFCIFNWAISVYSWVLLKEVSDPCSAFSHAQVTDSLCVHPDQRPQP